MKKNVILALATLFVLSFSAMSQPGRGKKRPMKSGEGKRMEITPEKRAEKMAKELNLSETEKAKVQDLFVKQAAKREAMKQEFVKLKEKFKAERQLAENELLNIIGQDKFIQLQAKRIEHLQKVNQMLMKKKGKKIEHFKIRKIEEKVE